MCDSDYNSKSNFPCVTCNRKILQSQGCTVTDIRMLKFIFSSRLKQSLDFHAPTDEIMTFVFAIRIRIYSV